MPRPAIPNIRITRVIGSGKRRTGFDIDCEIAVVRIRRRGHLRLVAACEEVFETPCPGQIDSSSE
jgi:hypothetical protein